MIKYKDVNIDLHQHHPLRLHYNLQLLPQFHWTHAQPHTIHKMYLCHIHLWSYLHNLQIHQFIHLMVHHLIHLNLLFMLARFEFILSRFSILIKLQHWIHSFNLPDLPLVNFLALHFPMMILLSYSLLLNYLLNELFQSLKQVFVKVMFMLMWLSLIV